MTLSQAITLVLNRVGLSATSTTLRDQARLYLVMTTTEITPLVPWWFLNRTTTFNTTSGTRTYTPITGNVTAWWSFVDETDERPLRIVGPDEYDLLDLDRDEQGNIEAVFVGGLDATTGYPVLELWRIPDSTNTIRVRYRIALSSWTAANDSTSLLVLGVPQILENALVYGATRFYLEEKGDDTGAVREANNMARVVKLAQKQNVAMQGNRRYPAEPPGQGSELLINVGSDPVVE